MLHYRNRLKKEYFFLLLSSFSWLTSCQHDKPVKSEEESAYMADYNSPVDKWGFINKQGQLAIAAVYDDVGPFSEGLASVNRGGLWGYIDLNGKMVIKPIYKSAWSFHEKMARVRQFDLHEQFIDQKGNILLTNDWSAADDFADGRARVKVGNSFGYIDSQGQLVVQAIYSRGWNFKNGLCIVEYHDKLAVIDLQGAYILRPEYDFIRIAGKNNLILCRSGNISLVFDGGGTELARIQNDKISDSDGHLVSVKQGNQMYLFDVLKQTVIKSIAFSNIIYLEDSLWAGKTNEGYLLINHGGQSMTSTIYNQINKFCDGFAAYSKGDYWGYLDEHGIERTSDIFGLAWDYREGLARAAFKDGIGFIDLQQKLAFYPPAGCLDLRDYSEGMASVQIKN